MPVTPENEVRHVMGKTDLSAHFTLAEAMRSQTASRLGIDNKPPVELASALMRVAEQILEPVRERFGKPFTPSSWYRCEELNKAIRGSPTSQHVKGEAVDIKIKGVSNYDIAVFIRDNLDFDQLILENYDPANPTKGWVHCSYIYPKENRREVLRFDGSYHEGLGEKN